MHIQDGIHLHRDGDVVRITYNPGRTDVDPPLVEIDVHISDLLAAIGQEIPVVAKFEATIKELEDKIAALTK